MLVVVLRRFGGNIKVNLMRFLTFMSFMMSWKSPPKALHSFSIPASIFPQARKKSSSNFLPPKEEKEKKKSFQPSFEILQQKNQWRLFFFFIYLVEGGVSYNTPRAKSTFKKQKQQQWKRRKNTHGSKKSRSGL